MTDLRETPEREALRGEFRGWLEENLPAGPLPHMDTPEGSRLLRDWDRRLFDAGWGNVAWPEEYGGRGAGIFDWLALEEEYALAGGPRRISQNGTALLAPSLFEFGTGEQRARILPRMLSAEEVWVQAWSETEAGSDLANVRSRAERDGAGWRLSGAKIWSSRAVVGDKAFGLFRTGTREERHRGLTYLLFDLRAPGVEVRPIPRVDGTPVFAEIALDGAFVPDEDVIGEPGRGWAVAMSTAGAERGVIHRSPGPFMASAAALASAAIEAGVAPESALAERVTRSFADADAYRLFTQALATHAAGGGRIGAEASISKLFSSELDVRVHDLARELFGPSSMMSGEAPESAGGGRWLEGFLAAQAATIWGGTNEIQRDIVAERVLGLPRSRG